ncbi:MAG: glutaminase A [Oscillospiraceae bacterium]
MQEAVNAAYEHSQKWLGQGQVANYIPELAKADPNDLAVCITDLGGRTDAIGQSKKKFTMQSISKVILLLTALHDVGFEDVFKRVGMEPSGDPFNSIIRLESMTSKPMNPMINAGAISVTSCITGQNAAERFEKVRKIAGLLMNDPDIDYSEEVYKSETQTGHRNRALAYMMLSSKIFEGSVEEHLEVYFKACSLMVSCEQLSLLGSILANDGVSPITGKLVVEPFHVKVLRSLMTTCGMYDASGEFAIRVGVPAKSGVGGGIMACVPNRMGIAAYSPALDPKGNSLCGFKALEYLSAVLDLSIF